MLRLWDVAQYCDPIFTYSLVATQVYYLDLAYHLVEQSGAEVPSALDDAYSDALFSTHEVTTLLVDHVRAYCDESNEGSKR